MIGIFFQCRPQAKLTQSNGHTLSIVFVDVGEDTIFEIIIRYRHTEPNRVSHVMRIHIRIVPENQIVVISCSETSWLFLIVGHIRWVGLEPTKFRV